jgi:D-alanyl-lipoteichoic acid acyltransferase DltB (MBOAT superfamily)
MRPVLARFMSFLGWNFNFYNSLPFWILVILIAAGARVVGRSRTAKRLFLGLASALMLLALPGFGPTSLVLVILLSLFTFFIGSGLAGSGAIDSTGKRKWAAGAGVAAVLAFLAFFKYGPVQEFIRSLLGFTGDPQARFIRLIGVSYFSFRMIHYLIESYRRKIEGADLLTYIDYIIFFPAFISGPINRFNHFAGQIESPAPARLAPDLRAGGERIVHGLFKKFVLAQLLYPHILSTRPEVLSEMGLGGAILGLYAYAFYFYFDFAGYTDLALGCARMIGIDLPENFNNPFLKRNIRELWTNWHMSLTSWLVDYIYWPLVRKFRGLEYFRRHPVLLSNLGMILTFIACGMWHGESLNFILWGAYHGLGIAALTVYQREKRKVRAPFLQKYFRSRLSTVLGTVLTFNFFAIGLSLFVLDMGRLRILIAAVLSKV